jgi:hypothetical protein
LWSLIPSLCKYRTIKNCFYIRKVFFCTAHLLFPNNDSRDPVFLHMHIKGNSCVFIFFVFVCRIMYLIFFLLDFGLSRLTSLQFIQYHVAGFYKPTIPQSPPSHLRDYSTCNNARLEFSTLFVPSFDPNEWCLKNGLHSGGLNPGLLGHESSALTTRP